MAQNYARLIFQYKSTGGPGEDALKHCNSRLQFGTIIVKNGGQHFHFYNSLAKLFQKMLCDHYFTQSNRNKVEEEISRLFRTNAFNSSERWNKQQKDLQKYPCLNQIPTVDYGRGKDVVNIKQRLLDRQKVPK